MSNINFTVAQNEAINYLQGNLLVIAGAGSGKTSTLTYRIINMLKHDVKPWQILAVTFTNKAAREMLERIKKHGYDDINIPTMGTFHSICFKILRNEITALNYQPNFTIYDTKEQETILKEAIKNMGIETNLDIKMLAKQISKYKNQLLSVAQAKRQADNAYQSEIANFYGAYQSLLQQNNAVDFDDLIMLTVELFNKTPDILTKYQKKWLYILVDEYQDTNEAQYQLIKLLSQTNNNLCVVGDFDQSIYAFRGAIITKILEFNQNFPQVKIVKLEQNFRSTQFILQASNAIIENNCQRLPKTLITSNPPGDKVQIWENKNQYEEAKRIVQEIVNLNKMNLANNSASKVILYRINASSRVLEEACLKQGLTYKIVGGLKFYDRKEIKDILAYLRILLNQQDTVSLLRIINVPTRKIGDTTITKLQNFALNRNLSLLEVLKHINMVDNLSLGTKQILQNFIDLYQSLKEDQLLLPLSELISSIIQKTQYYKLINDDSVESLTRKENLLELKLVASRYDHLSTEALSTFLEEVSLMQEADSIDEDKNMVYLMTIHTAKGLEFDHVFVTGLEESVFPHERSLYDPTDLEEERRLMYVAMTRAKQKLYLTYCQEREIFGKLKKNGPSRFLGEIPSNLVETSFINRQINIDYEKYRYVRDDDWQA